MTDTLIEPIDQATRRQQEPQTFPPPKNTGWLAARPVGHGQYAMCPAPILVPRRAGVSVFVPQLGSMHAHFCAVVTSEGDSRDYLGVRADIGASGKRCEPASVYVPNVPLRARDRDHAPCRSLCQADPQPVYPWLLASLPAPGCGKHRQSPGGGATGKHVREFLRAER